MPVLAGAAVSVPAIIALVAGRRLGWLWKASVLALVASVVILSWSWILIGLPHLRFLMHVLIRQCPARSQASSNRIVTDPHLWRVGPSHLAAVISLVTHGRHSPDYYKRRLPIWRHFLTSPSRSCLVRALVTECPLMARSRRWRSPLLCLL
jgi:Co/Zn/Cd efflux system component